MRYKLSLELCCVLFSAGPALAGIIAHVRDANTIEIADVSAVNECTDKYWKRWKIYPELMKVCEELAQSGDAAAAAMGPAS